MQSFDLSEPLFYISTKRIQPTSKKGKGAKVKHATMKNKSRFDHYSTFLVGGLKGFGDPRGTLFTASLDL